MEGDPGPEEATLFPTTVGEKLRAAREAQGLDLAEVAARTRIPQRHLESIERSNYASLPSATYALGFAKAYARAVGADEVALGRELRKELDTNFERVAPQPAYEMNDPTRTPPRGMVWVGVIIALLVVVGAGVWYGTSLFRGSAPPPEPLEIPQETPSATPTPQTGGQVSLVALDTVWLRVTDASGKLLFEKEMQTGERYDVPPDADHPRAKTGRPDKIQVVVNGSNVPPLGRPAEQVEVEVSAEALLARGSGPASASTPAPAAASTPSAQTPAPTSAAPSRPRPTPTPRPRSTPTPSGPISILPPGMTPPANTSTTP